MTVVLDHLAIGTPALTDGWELFGGLLGGTWVYGMDSPGYWWGQLEFAAGPKVELLTPTGGPDAAFLERFLAARGPARTTSTSSLPTSRPRWPGSEPSASSPSRSTWPTRTGKRRSCTPAAPMASSSRSLSRPAPRGRRRREELPEPGPPTSLDLIEHRVGDLAGATRLFREALDGHLEAAADDTAELTWPGGKRIRLVREDGLPLGGSLHHVRFTRTEGAFGAQDRERAGLLAKRLGLAVELAG